MGNGNWNFVWELVHQAAISPFSDLGTNFLGWLVTVGTPFAVLALRFLRAPKGERWAFVISQYRSEIRDVVVFYFLVWMAVFAYELFRNIPHQIRMHADEVKPPALPTSVRAMPEFISVPNPINPQDASGKLRADSHELIRRIAEFLDDRSEQWKRYETYTRTRFVGAPTLSEDLAMERRQSEAKVFEDFRILYMKDVSDLIDRMSLAGVNTSLTREALLLGDARYVACSLIQVSNQIGKRPPVGRIFTPLQAHLVLGSARPQNVEVSAYGMDTNSRQVGETIIAGLAKNGWTVNEHVLLIPARIPRPNGVKIYYQYGDQSAMDELHLGFVQCGLAVQYQGPHSPWVPNKKLLEGKQVGIKIEVWPESHSSP